jgi:TetR/AcrR family transcriptional regulator
MGSALSTGIIRQGIKGREFLYENFEKIPLEEQQRLLQVCIAEFSTNGYQQASTNTIVKQAGIPKGTLFYFFGSKKDLYLYVLDYAIRQFARRYTEMAGDMPTDLFERLLHRGRIKFQFAAEEPELFQLFYNAFINTPQEIQEELRSRAGGYAASSEDRLMEGLDLSRFREDVDVQEAVALIQLMLDGLLNKYLSVFRKMTPDEALVLVERINHEAKAYFQLIQKGIYR